MNTIKITNETYQHLKKLSEKSTLSMTKIVEVTLLSTNFKEFRKKMDNFLSEKDNESVKTSTKGSFEKRFEEDWEEPEIMHK